MKIIVKHKLYLILLAGGSLVFLLFFEKSHIFSTRSWQHAWNLGHVPLFILCGYSVFHYFPDINNKKLLIQFLLLASLALFLGLGIEIIQEFVGRQASLQDVMLDVVGAIVSVVLFSHGIRRLNLHLKILYSVLVISLVLYSSLALITSLWDEYHSRRDFPVLSNFERASEIDRWTSIEKMEISGDVSVMGLKSLKFIVTQRHYSGIELQYFPGDWSGHDYLILHVFNPAYISVSLVISIYDKQHSANQFAFNDRYTERFHLQHGWNEVKVSLDEIKNAPRKRAMDITKISGLRLFVVRPRKIQQFYIDGIRLEN